MYKIPNTPVKNTFLIFPNIFYSFLLFFCSNVGFLVPGTRRTPQKLNRYNQQSPIISNAYIKQPLQGEHCRSQRFYRHSVFSQCLTTTMSDSSLSFYCACRNYVSPIKVKIQWWSCGVPPPSPKRLFCIGFRIITAFAAGKL